MPLARKLLVLALVVGAVAAIRHLLFALNERRLDEAGSPVGPTHPDDS